MMLQGQETDLVLPWCPHGLILSQTGGKNHEFGPDPKDFSLARNQLTDPYIPSQPFALIHMDPSNDVVGPRDGSGAVMVSLPAHPVLDWG